MEFAKHDIRDYDVIVGLQNVTNPEFRVIALFNSVFSADAQAKWMSEKNPDRQVVVFTEGYARIWVNGELSEAMFTDKGKAGN